MAQCIWCLTHFPGGPPEHTIQESLDGYVVTDKVCLGCNNRIGSHLEGAAEGFPLIVKARKRLGLIKVNTPPAPDEKVFKRLVVKMAVEFLAERAYTVALDPSFNSWRELVLYGKHEDVLLPKVSVEDIYASKPGYAPVLNGRNLKHAIFIDTINGELQLAVHFYGQILCKVNLGHTTHDVPKDHVVMSIQDGASKVFRWSERDSWPGQKIVIPGMKRKKGRRKPEPWFRQNRSLT